MADGESSERPSPYLDSLSGDAAERITAMKWARYLGAAFGPSGAMSALRYYVEVGWISDDVRRAMVDYVRGLTIDELELSEVEPELHGSLQNLEDTAFERHARSLQFVAAISGRSIEHGLASLQIAESVAPGVGGNVGVGATAGQPPSTGATGGPFPGGAMAPGEQAEMAAGASQRQRDRSRRDERASRTSHPDASGNEQSPDSDGAADQTQPADGAADQTPPADGTTDQTQPAHGSNAGADQSSDDGRSEPDPDRHDEADLEVSMADVTPGSSGAGESVDPVAQDDQDAEADGEFDPSETTDDDPLSDWRRHENGDGADEWARDAGEWSPDGPSPASESNDGVGDVEPTPEPSPSPSLSFDGSGDRSDGEPESADGGSVPGEVLQHTIDEDRCIAVMQGGDRCNRTAAEGRDYCQEHARK